MKKVMNFLSGILFTVFTISMVVVLIRIVLEVIKLIGMNYHSFSRFILENDNTINFVFFICLCPVFTIGIVTTLYKIGLWVFEGIKSLFSK